MHWQYYQKVFAAYFAASSALGVEAQAQAVFNLPGDGGMALSSVKTYLKQAHRPIASFRESQHLGGSLIENVSAGINMKNSTSRSLAPHLILAHPIGEPINCEMLII